MTVPTVKDSSSPLNLALMKYPGYRERGQHTRRARFIAAIADLSALGKPTTYLDEFIKTHYRPTAHTILGLRPTT